MVLTADERHATVLHVHVHTEARGARGRYRGEVRGRRSRTETPPRKCTAGARLGRGLPVQPEGLRPSPFRPSGVFDFHIR
jgi:hypothetical protein